MHHSFSMRAVSLLIVVLLLTSCGVVTGTSGSGTTDTRTPGQPVVYDHAASAVILQLYPIPGFVYPAVNGVPEWTLFGDGTLVFRAQNASGPAAQLRQAHLDDTQVEDLLTYAVLTHHIFATTRHTYGQFIPDAGTTLLRISAAGQQRELVVAPVPGANPDTQTSDVFAILRFVSHYQPAQSVPLVPDRVALFVVSITSATSQPWPISAINLQSAANADCYLLLQNQSCASVPAGGRGLLTLVGPDAKVVASQPGTDVYTQGAKSFRVLVWPLLQDVPPFGYHPDSAGNPVPALTVAMDGHLEKWPLFEQGTPLTGL